MCGTATHALPLLPLTEIPIPQILLLVAEGKLWTKPMSKAQCLKAPSALFRYFLW